MLNPSAPQPIPLRPRGLTPELLPPLPPAELCQRFVAAVIDERGREIPITEAMIDAALRAFDTTLAPAEPAATATPAPTPAH